MSHTTTLSNIKIADFDALKQTVAELIAAGARIRLVQNQKPRMYYNDQYGVCPYVIQLLDGPYDVGLAQKDGGLVPVYDAHGGHIARQLGVDGGDTRATVGRLLQGYAKNAAINAARAQGYMVEDVTVDRDGNLHIQVAVG